MDPYASWCNTPLNYKTKPSYSQGKSYSEGGCEQLVELYNKYFVRGVYFLLVCIMVPRSLKFPYTFFLFSMSVGYMTSSSSSVDDLFQ